MEGVLLNPAKIISTTDGDVLHALKNNEDGFENFGEAYFSTIEPNSIKAWKCHTKMILNILVPIGEIKFVLYDDRQKSKTRGSFEEYLLSQQNYQRLTIPPFIWMGFQGVYSKSSMLLNIANIIHDPKEAIHKNLDDINYHWS
jgi:dTDP-4-dehydrorhamnose 3,5-epimerase